MLLDLHLVLLLQSAQLLLQSAQLLLQLRAPQHQRRHLLPRLLASRGILYHLSREVVLLGGRGRSVVGGDRRVRIVLEVVAGDGGRSSSEILAFTG